jgi:hypothetical protein
MESTGSNAFFSSMVVFSLLSVGVWLISYFPAARLVVAQVQRGIHMGLESPLVGWALFGVVVISYLGAHYGAPRNLNSMGDRYVSSFINIWIIALTAFIVFSALVAAFAVRKTKIAAAA